MLLDLDPDQREAVLATESRVVVRAGPGAGKTRVIVARVARLLEDGVAPSAILVCAFTRTAAAEVRARLAAIGADAVVTTLHGWAAAFCRRHADKLGLRPDFTVQDEEESDRLVCDIGAELRLPWKSAKRLRDDDRVMERYAHRMRESSRVDYDGLEAMALRLLRDGFRPGFAHVLVDEGQDTNRTEQELLRRMGAALFLVGDTSQALYRFRGGDPEGFWQMALEDGAEGVELRTNYRSGRAVVDAAQRLELTPRPVAQVAAAGEGAVGVTTQDEVAWQVSSFLATGSCAVLSPTWAQIEAISVELTIAGVPHVVSRRGKLWTSPEARRVLAVLRLLACPFDRMAAELLLGDAARSPAWRRALAEGIERDDLIRETAIRFGNVNTDSLANAMLLARGGGPSLADVCASLAWDEDLTGAPRDALLTAAETATDAADLVAALLEDDAGDLPVQEGAALLTTIHGAKGREWDHVWILGCEPGGMRGSPDDIRRLLYVATTRARRTCAWVVPTASHPVSTFVAEMQVTS